MLETTDQASRMVEAMVNLMVAPAAQKARYISDVSHQALRDTSLACERASRGQASRTRQQSAVATAPASQTRCASVVAASLC